MAAPTISALSVAYLGPPWQGTVSTDIDDTQIFGGFSLNSTQPLFSDFLADQDVDANPWVIEIDGGGTAVFNTADSPFTFDFTDPPPPGTYYVHIAARHNIDSLEEGNILTFGPVVVVGGPVASNPNLKTVFNGGLNLNLDEQPINHGVHLAKDQSFDINCRGLRPFTEHRFFIDGEDRTQFCKPMHGGVGDALITDSNGKIVMKYFHTAGIDESMDSHIDELTYNVHGGKMFELKAESSSAVCMVEFHSGVSTNHQLVSSDDLWKSDRTHHHKNRNGRR